MTTIQNAGQSKIQTVTGANNGEREFIITMMNTILVEWRNGNLSTDRAGCMALDICEAAMSTRKHYWNVRMELAFRNISDALLEKVGYRCAAFDFAMAQHGIVGLCWAL